MKASLPGREALPKGRTPALKGGTLQSLTPGILGPSSPIKLEKNHILEIKVEVESEKEKDIDD